VTPIGSLTGPGKTGRLTTGAGNRPGPCGQSRVSAKASGRQLMTVNIQPGRAGPATPPGSPVQSARDTPPGETCDAELIRRSATEPEQFAMLFRRHSGALHRYVARRLGAGQAEDIVAEVFLTAFRQRDRYQHSQPDARPWLYGIATNLIGRHRRAEVRLYRALARTGADPVSEPFTDRVEDRVTAAGTARPLAAALARLPAAHRDTLLLVAWGDLTYEQTATSLGVPVGTVRSRISRARARLRKALADQDISHYPQGEAP
jgi:RNA polymerase sigma-70 factor, ECF subfamily